MNVFFASCIIGTSQKHRLDLVRNEISSHHAIAAEYVNKLDADAEEDTFSNIANKILLSDVYIAEMSLPSQTLGFQIAFALSNGKPCLYLYDDRSSGKPATPIYEHPSRMLKISSYNAQNIGKKLQSFYSMAESQMSSRRTSFMSTHEIDAYVVSESKRLGVHKAEVIRQALHEAAQQKKHQ